MVSSGNGPVMPPPVQSVPSTYPSDNCWLLWKLLRPWRNDVGPQEVSKPSSYLVPEQRSRHRQAFFVFCDVSASQPDGLIRQRLTISWSDAKLEIEASRSYVMLRYLQHACRIHSLWGWGLVISKAEGVMVATPEELIVQVLRWTSHNLCVFLIGGDSNIIDCKGWTWG